MCVWVCKAKTSKRPPTTTTTPASQCHCTRYDHRPGSYDVDTTRYVFLTHLLKWKTRGWENFPHSWRMGTVYIISMSDEHQSKETFAKGFRTDYSNKMISIIIIVVSTNCIEEKYGFIWIWKAHPKWSARIHPILMDTSSSRRDWFIRVTRLVAGRFVLRGFGWLIVLAICGPQEKRLEEARKRRRKRRVCQREKKTRAYVVSLMCVRIYRV